MKQIQLLRDKRLRNPTSSSPEANDSEFSNYHYVIHPTDSHYKN